MFTLKFYKSSDATGEHSEISSSVSCSRYDKQETLTGFIFTTYPSDCETAVEFRVDDNHANDFSFERAFIENQAGKTIDAVVHKSSLTRATI